MTLPSSGQLTLADIAAELGRPGSQISLNDADVRALAGIPSGQIIMPYNFYGKAVPAPSPSPAPAPAPTSESYTLVAGTDGANSSNGYRMPGNWLGIGPIGSLSSGTYRGVQIEDIITVYDDGTYSGRGPTWTHRITLKTTSVGSTFFSSAFLGGTTLYPQNARFTNDNGSVCYWEWFYNPNPLFSPGQQYVIQLNY